MKNNSVAELNDGAEPRWFRQFWPWFLIAFPLTAVLAGFFTLYLAIISDTGLVEDDYYKRGLAINTDLGRYQRAAELGLWADIVFVRDAGGAGEVEVRLHSNKVDKVPELAMRLALIHPTQAERDQRIELTPSGDGLYRGQVAASAPGYWHINLESAGGEWRITGRAHLAEQQQVTLTSG